MIQVIQCPSWEYKDVPGYADTLKARSAAILISLRTDNGKAQATRAKDTRPTHATYFAGLTPPGFDHYAGHYRGENLECLRDYEVKIRNDPRVGHAPSTVPLEMAEFALGIGRVIAELDFLWEVNEQIVSAPEKLLRTIELTVALFVYFLAIHPFANGNGHMARLLVRMLTGSACSVSAAMAVGSAPARSALLRTDQQISIGRP